MEKFWWSGETQADVGDAFAKTMKAIASELNHLLAEVSLGGKVEQWAFIAIIREEDSPIYNEVVKRSSRGKVLEFRLKIPHAAFLAASPAEKIGLILKALARSVDLMGQLGVSTDTQNALRAVLFRAENQGASSGPVN
jgi:Immunity protein 44